MLPQADRQWQQDTDLGPARGTIVDADLPAMLVDDLLHDRQTEACPPGLGGHVWLEDPRHEFRRKTGAGIGNSESRHVVRVFSDAGEAPATEAEIAELMAQAEAAAAEAGDAHANGDEQVIVIRKIEKREER